MRALRDSLTAGRLLPAAGLAAALAACGQPPTDVKSQPPVVPPAPATPAADSAIRSDYYPLALGNSWTYACSAEGEAQLQKRTELVAEATINGRPGYRVAFSVDGDVTDQYVWEGTDNIVYRAMSESGQGAEPVISRTAGFGDSFGPLKATRIVEQETPATGKIQALVLENLDFDDPDVPEQRRMEWRGQFYASGIGLVAEGDGLGNDCALTAYVVK